MEVGGIVERIHPASGTEQRPAADSITSVAIEGGTDVVSLTADVTREDDRARVVDGATGARS
jgi:hypothetical protein